MSEEDIKTIARIVANQNIVILDCRIQAVKAMLQTWHNDEALSIELAVLQLQKDLYAQTRVERS